MESGSLERPQKIGTVKCPLGEEISNLCYDYDATLSISNEQEMSEILNHVSLESGFRLNSSKCYVVVVHYTPQRFKLIQDIEREDEVINIGSK